MSHYTRRHATHGGRETASKRRHRLVAFNRLRKSGSTRKRLAEARKRLAVSQPATPGSES